MALTQERESWFLVPGEGYVSYSSEKKPLKTESPEFFSAYNALKLLYLFFSSVDSINIGSGVFWCFGQLVDF